MPDQKTVNRSTVDTSDQRVVEPDASERDITGRAPVEPDAPERDITQRDVREPDASESETARERAEMVGVAEPTAGAAGDPDAATAADDPSNADGEARDESQAADGSTSVETVAPGGAPADYSGASLEPGPAHAEELAPGDLPAPQSTTLWAGEDGEALRERWREVQSRFVDDPRGAAAAADDLIGEAVDSITQELAAQRRQLGEWRAGGDSDTERLRVAVTGYRDFLDRVLSI